jgi:drug/metabolite transporter (DMT)-like permease
VSHRGRIIAAFAAVYIIWSSTYLAIGYAVETIPPFLMAGIRFLLAGAIMYGWTRARGAAAPTRIQWRSAFIIGGLLLTGGNGGVSWAEQYVPTGLASLLVAAVPLWVVLIDWLRPNGARPGGPTVIGVLIGLAGMALLVSQRDSGGQPIHVLGLMALIIAPICWAGGSVYSRSAKLPASPLLSTGIQMLAGGVLLMMLGTVTGEWQQLDIGKISATSLLALFYLVTFGAIIAFTAYIFLLKHTTPARAATYAYVNPPLAVLLGWLFRGETLTPVMLLAAGIIVAAVFIIITYRDRRPRPALLRPVLAERS